MTVLFDSKCLKECLKIHTGKSKYSITTKKFYDIIYNESSLILFSKNYLNHLENILPDVDVFQALIKELHDGNKLEIGNTSGTKNINDEFIEVFKSCTNNYLFPITIENDLAYLNFNGTTFSKIKSSSYKFKVIDALLTKGIFVTSYQDFKSNDEITAFFEDIFLIPRIKHICIFNREVDYEYLTGLKGCNIHYYTLVKPADIKYVGECKEELKHSLGNKTKLFFTTNRRMIHERKIIIDGLIITPDNSFTNLVTNEPTWEISVAFDTKKAKNWLEKCSDFKEVY